MPYPEHDTVQDRRPDRSQFALARRSQAAARAGRKGACLGLTIAGGGERNDVWPGDRNAGSTKTGLLGHSRPVRVGVGTGTRNGLDWDVDRRASALMSRLLSGSDQVCTWREDSDPSMSFANWTCSSAGDLGPGFASAGSGVRGCSGDSAWPHSSGSGVGSETCCIRRGYPELVVRLRLAPGAGSATLRSTLECSFLWCSLNR